MINATYPGDVRVFRNLTRACYSVQARTPTGPGGRMVWRTVAHADALSLDAPTFVVSPTGRDRVRRTGRKAVHAWIYGTLRAWSGRTYKGRHADALWTKDAEGCAVLPSEVTYNPRVHEGFVLRDGLTRIHTADRADLRATGVTVLRYGL